MSKREPKTPFPKLFAASVKVFRDEQAQSALNVPEAEKWARIGQPRRDDFLALAALARELAEALDVWTRTTTIKNVPVLDKARAAGLLPARDSAPAALRLTRCRSCGVTYPENETHPDLGSREPEGTSRR